MKVAVLTSVHSPFDARIFHKECRSLARAGHEVTLIAPGARDELVAGVHVRGVPGSAQRRLRRATTTVWQIYTEALRINAAVYHLHDPELLPIGLLLRRRHGKQVIYDAHEDLPRTVASKEYVPRGFRPPLALLAEVLEQAIACRLSAVIAATPVIAARFARLTPRTVVVRNYVELSEWRAERKIPWNDRPRSVAYVGGLTWERGLREMIESMALLRTARDTRLVLAGAYSPPELRMAAARLAGWEHVDELGVIQRDAVVNLLGRVRAGVVVLHPTPNYVPSLPVKLFEYMAAGLPAIASDFPELRAIVEEAGCGILVDPCKPADVAAATEFLVTHPAEAELMGRRGSVAAAQRYNWATEERTLCELYAGLAETASPPRPSAASRGVRLTG